MMTDLLRRVNKIVQEEQNRYAGLNFTRNPFPTRPSVTPGSSDDRENGSIYVPQLRQKEGATFEKLLIPSDENPQTRSIAFLMDFATRRGRGIGKTAFLHYQKNRIMEDLGNQLSGGNEVIFSVYVFPGPDGRTRKFWQFHRLLIKALVEQEILATAMCRLRAFSGIIPQDILSKVGEDLQQTIGNDEWLIQQNINVKSSFMGKKSLNDEVYRKLISIGIDPEPAQKLADFGHNVSDFESYIELCGGVERMEELRKQELLL